MSGFEFRRYDPREYSDVLAVQWDGRVEGVDARIEDFADAVEHVSEGWEHSSFWDKGKVALRLRRGLLLTLRSGSWLVFRRLSNEEFGEPEVLDETTFAERYYDAEVFRKAGRVEPAYPPPATIERADRPDDEPTKETL